MPGDDPPRVFQPLPGRTVDRSAAYEAVLRELLRLTGAEPPVLGDEPDAARRWRHRARRAVGTAVAGRARAAAGSASVPDAAGSAPVPDAAESAPPDAGQSAPPDAAQSAPVPGGWFEPLLRAAVHEPDPSFVRDLIRPAIDAFGRRRVRLALLAHLQDGSPADAAGAARAWYWTLIGVRFVPGTQTLTPESAAERDRYRDLDRRYLATALHRFVTDDDLDLRRCLLPGLSLRPRSYPAEMQELVSQALEIARTSDDEYLRHRAEIQAD